MWFWFPEKICSFSLGKLYVCARGSGIVGGCVGGRILIPTHVCLINSVSKGWPHLMLFFEHLNAVQLVYFSLCSEKRSTHEQENRFKIRKQTHICEQLRADCYNSGNPAVRCNPETTEASRCKTATSPVKHAWEQQNDGRRGFHSSIDDRKPEGLVQHHSGLS